MTDPRPTQFGLSPDEAIANMRDVQLPKMRAETKRDQLKDIDPDTAYELGYETAIFDYGILTGPDPREVALITITDAEEASNDDDA